MVKQEMARVNIDILGINELKWMGMGEFNSDDPYIYYYGQESLVEMESTEENDVNFVSKSINITVIQVYAPITKDKEAEVK